MWAYPLVSWKCCRSRRNPSRSLVKETGSLPRILAIVAQNSCLHHYTCHCNTLVFHNIPIASRVGTLIAARYQTAPTSVLFTSRTRDAHSRWPGSRRLPALALTCTHSDRINAQKHDTREHCTLLDDVKPKITKILTNSPRKSFI